MKSNLILLCTVVAGLAAVLPIRATVLLTTYRQQNANAIGQVFQIRWDDDLDESEKQVMLWDGDRGVLRAISGVLPPNVHEFVWQVPANILDGTRYRFIVRNPNNTHKADFSDGFTNIFRAQPLLTAVEDNEFKTGIQLTPFPASETVQVAWPEARVVERIDLLNIHYELLASTQVQPGATSSTISVKQCPSGMAIVRLISPGGLSVGQPLLVVH